MADLETIRIPVDASDFPKAVAQSEKLERTINKLYSALNTGKINAGQFKEGLRQLNSQNVELFGSVQKTTYEIHKYATGIAEAKAATLADKAAKEQLTASLQSARIAINSMNAERKAEALATREQAAADKALASEKQNLIAKYNPVTASMQLYAREQANIKRAAELKIITEAQEAQQLARLKTQYDEYTQGIARAGNIFVNGATRSTRSMNAMGMATQQVGYQVGDFLVQVQSGTNWMVAFGQQATQAVGVLGIMNPSLIGIGTALGIIIPLVTAVGAAWMRTSEESNKTSKATKELEDRIKSIDRTLQDWLLTKKASKAGLTVDELIGAESIEDAKKKVADLTIEVKKLESAAALIGQGMAGGIDLQSLFGESPSDKLKMAIEELSAAEERLSNLRKKSYEETLDKSNEILKSKQQELELVRLEAKHGSDSVVYKEAAYKLERDIYLQKLATDGLYAGEIQKIKDVMDSTHQVQTATEGANKMLQIGADLWATISSRAKAAADQAAAYASATAAGANLRTLPDERGSQREATRSAAEANTSRILEEMGRNPDGTPKKPKKASGGGGSAGREATQESRLQGFLSQTYDFLAADNLTGQGLENQLAQEQAAYDKRIAQLEAFLQKKQLTQEEYNELEKSLTERHEQDIALIRQQAQNQQLNDMGGFFGAMASAMQTGGDKMVKVASVFSAAQALINSWTAYTEMLKDPAFVGRPWARFAAAASVLAAGLNAVKAIKSVGSGGGGGGGGSASSQTSTTAATQTSTPQQVYISGLTADQLFTGEQLQNLFDNLQTENKNRGYVFVTARQ